MDKNCNNHVEDLFGHDLDEDMTEEELEYYNEQCIKLEDKERR